MNDDRVIRYVYLNYACVNGVVTMTQVGNKVDLSPNQIMIPANGIQARTFRNKQGSYFFKVADAYRGLIGGKRMTDYPTGGVYEDSSPISSTRPRPLPSAAAVTATTPATKKTSAPASTSAPAGFPTTRSCSA
ncbi:hypothetical protein [Geobacter argillaceus]|uniref:Uncharacterized protein n=1 Tax=Geobacter argillaceus TaxID=345631 RepID=A0A562V602_9BACT|nr:hypothetical protein [Geobacter argillaceus]TWJ13315.1 hypothetical protein JN12_03904 [Geobacter argillaceus]